METKCSPLNIMNSSSFDDLPKETFSGGQHILYNWEGFWYVPYNLKGAMKAQSLFKAHNDDVFLASSPKTGSTWLKALIPCIMNPRAESEDLDPLIHNHPDALIPSLEMEIFMEGSAYDPSSMPSPRLFRTHIPYSSLPGSIKDSDSKIVYISRNPKDTFVSWWHFLNCLRSSKQEPRPIGETFEEYSKGIHPFGPFHDHVIGYWNESLKSPEKILFMRYEEMKRDPKGEVKKLALFLGRPFQSEEDVEKVLWRCSIDRLKSLEVNKFGNDPWTGIPKSAHFRRGVVGDWKNSLTAEMAERLDEITLAKMKGLALDLST